MSALPIIRRWRRQVRDDLLPHAHGHQAKALADLSYAIAAAGHCHSGKLAAHAPGDSTPAATRRRCERTLANDRIDPETLWPQLAHAATAGYADGPLTLILDETPNRNDLRCLKLTLAFRHRAVPLLAACYALGGPDEPMPDLVRRLLRRAATCLPPGAEVTLLADRGLAWPQVVDVCVKLGWHYVIRLQGQTRVRTADGREGTAADLAPAPGADWHGPAEVFKKAGWRRAAVAACWRRDQDGPWLVVSDRDDGPRLFGRYRKRTWTEELFRDEKSAGFHWDQSRVRDPAHAGRLLVILALATLLALGLGARLVDAGAMGLIASGQRRRLSYFQLGLRLLVFSLTHDPPLPNDGPLIPP